jgi:tetratricopeptide (TPR) repeat protein
MKRLLIGLLFCTLAIACSAQPEPAKAGLTKPKVTETGRMGEIFGAYQERIADQIDNDFEEGDFPRIINLLKVQADLDRSAYETWTDLIWMLGNVQLYDEQITTARQFRNFNPTKSEAWYPEAEIYFLKRSSLKVIPIMEEALKLPGRHDPNSFRILALSWTRLGFKTEAIRVWEAMIKQYPNDERAQAQLQRLKSGG